MFGDEGQRVLEGQGRGLFPVTVRPVAFRLLWLAVVVLAVAAAAVVVGIGGRLG